MHEHYAKPMATRLIISARSAHSDQTKRSVHVSECVSRMVNTSPDLSWEEHIVPHLTGRKSYVTPSIFMIAS